MNLPARIFLSLGALNVLLAVVAGAYGAHAFNGYVEQAALFQTAIQYHFVHALGLIAIGIVLGMRSGVAFVVVGGLMLGGVLLFCGSLYLAAVTGYRTGLAPVGGMAFMAAWATFGIAALRRPSETR